MTIQEAIEQLEQFKAKYGPDTRLLMPSPSHNEQAELFTFEFKEGRTAKNNDWKLVTKGGNPCVIIWE